MAENLGTFKYFAENFLLVQELELEGLKKNIKVNQDKSWPSEFKKQLKIMIESLPISRNDYELITDHEFESDDEYRDWLKSIWSYLYEDGSIPD